MIGCKHELILQRSQDFLHPCQTDIQCLCVCEDRRATSTVISITSPNHDNAQGRLRFRLPRRHGAHCSDAFGRLEVIEMVFATYAGPSPSLTAGGRADQD